MLLSVLAEPVYELIAVALVLHASMRACPDGREAGLAIWVPLKEITRSEEATKELAYFYQIHEAPAMHVILLMHQHARVPLVVGDSDRALARTLARSHSSCNSAHDVEGPPRLPGIPAARGNMVSLA